MAHGHTWEAREAVCQCRSAWASQAGDGGGRPQVHISAACSPTIKDKVQRKQKDIHADATMHAVQKHVVHTKSADNRQRLSHLLQKSKDTDTQALTGMIKATSR